MKSYRCFAVWVGFVAMALGEPAFAQAPSGALGSLLEGVEEIGRPGIPGPLCVFGNDAFVVATGRSGRRAQEPVAAAGTMGEGRVFAFGHTGYLTPETLSAADTGRLLANAIGWTANKADAKDGNPRVGAYRSSDLESYLNEKGFEAAGAAIDELGAIDVLLVDAGRISDDDVEKLARFVKEGGGLIAAGLGWGWKQLHPDRDLANDFNGNRLLAPMGIVWADGTLNARRRGNRGRAAAGFAVGPEPLKLAHAGRAFEAAIESAGGGVKIEASDIGQISTVLSRAAHALPVGDTILLPKLHELTEKYAVSSIPTPDHPFKAENFLERLSFTIQFDKMMNTPPEQTHAHRAAEAFPGSVPEGAPEVERTISIDTEVPGWHGLGLYAAPGELIVVRTPESAAGKGLKVRIGAHRDRLWNKDEWLRAPEITREFAIDRAETHAANAFGGLVYIDAPEDGDLGTISVTISGAVESPLFVRGKTSLQEWRETIRNRPGPWAEVGSDKIILTVPSASVRGLDDPESLMRVWDEVMDACADLAAWDRKRKRPERIVPDVQISAGYMHAGYPIMTLADQNDLLVDREALLNGKWGYFHEIGHNHQNYDWTFGGTGEVTCNLFSLYVLEKVCGKGKDFRATTTEARRKQMIAKYLAGGADFEQWKRDPWLALAMYIQMQEAFGWDAFKKVFAEYRALPESQRPRTQDEKRDQWLIRFSRTVGKNLGPFYKAWGVPTSEEARSQITDLPTWMPDDFPPAETAG